MMSDVIRDTLHDRRTTEGYWVVIPAYNEAATVRDVAMRARQQCANVIVVDDGSTDGTARAVADLDVTLLRNEENRGKAGSLVRGFDHALGQEALGVITLDADGQHAPEEIPQFLDSARRDPSAFLFGVRHREQRRSSIWRYAANRIADFWISWAAGRWIDDSQSGFRLYPANLLRNVQPAHDLTRSFVFESEFLIEASRRGFACRALPISVSRRTGPRGSHFRPAMDITRITVMVGGKLIGRGMYLRGLWSVLCTIGRRRQRVIAPASSPEESSADLTLRTLSRKSPENPRF